MPQPIRWFSSLIICLLALFWAAKPAEAAAEFEVEYQTLYQLDSDGLTTVTHRIALTNKLSAVYATSFTLDIGLTDVGAVAVRDAVGSIEPQISQGNGSTRISFQFIDKVVGKGKVNNFSVSYRTRDIVTRNGSIWEINIPRLEGEHAASTYGVTLVVPAQFGQPAFLSPRPDSVAPAPKPPAGFNTYRWAAHLGFQPPVTAVFGRTQYMDFLLQYHLENTNAAVRSKTTIALPPDTAYQRIALKQIEPAPDQVELDGDGNWLASYSLSPGQLLTIQVSGVAKLEFEPQLQPETEEMLAAYMVPLQYWESDNAEIQSLAAKLRTPKAIYQYVVDNLTYSYDKVNQGGGRVGAAAALISPELAICTEFTDLFVALSRAAGIPAREKEGYAFTTNDRLRPLSLTQDVLHAWPEYYDREQQTWVQVDPTWGKTTGGIDYFSKLDLNHFTFVTHGLDSVKPAPAGAYKLKSDPRKDVEVHATAPIAWPAFDLAFSLENENNPKQPALIVRNVGQVSSSTTVTLTSDPTGIIDTSFQLATLPPYGFEIIALNPDLPWSLEPISFTLEINDGQRFVSLPIRAQRPLPAAVKLALIAALAVVAGAAGWAWRLRLHRYRGQPPLHW